MTSHVFWGELQALRERPIQNLLPAQWKRVNYRSHPINAEQALFHEPLIDLCGAGLCGRNFYNRPDNPPYYTSIPGSLTRLYLRKSVADRLLQVDARIAPLGLRIFVYDALRPIEVQRYFHDVWMPEQVRRTDPDLSDEKIAAKVEQYWAAPSTDSSPSPHATGAAVDLTLCFADGREPLYMGSIFDEATVLAHTDYFEHHANPERFSDVEARLNRRLLYWLMHSVGFANHPYEWWHYSWGDQFWARIMDKDSALYGNAEMSGLA